MPGSAAPLYVFGPKLIKRQTSQAGGGWPGRAQTLAFSFEATVALTPQNGKRLSIVVSGLTGVVAGSGGNGSAAVAITGAQAASFTSCAVLAPGCGGSEGVWDQDAHTLTLHLKAEIGAFAPTAVSFSFNNALQGQDPPALFVAVTSSFEVFEVAPALLGPSAGTCLHSFAPSHPT